MTTNITPINNPFIITHPFITRNVFYANAYHLIYRTLECNIVYMSNNMSDEEYFVEQKLLKDAIAKAEQETPIAFNNRDLTVLKETLETNFEELYAMLNLEDKRRFWRSLIKEIKIKGNAPVSVTFN